MQRKFIRDRRISAEKELEAERDQRAELAVELEKERRAYREEFQKRLETEKALDKDRVTLRQQADEIRLMREALVYRIVIMLRDHGPSYGLRLAEALGEPAGRVYLVLRNLERAGILESYEMNESLEIRGGRPRRYYRLLHWTDRD